MVERVKSASLKQKPIRETVTPDETLHKKATTNLHYLVDDAQRDNALTLP